MTKKFSRVLLISDLHLPYEHPDAFAFLSALKKYINPDCVIGGGDEIDFHGISMHDSDPDLYSAGHELYEAKRKIKELEKMFPTMKLLHSNHSSLIYRRGLKHGIPKGLLKDYNDFLEVGKGWEWVDNLVINLSDGSQCFLTHGMSANVLKVAMQYGKSVVQFHYHSTYSIQYFSNPDALIWAMQLSCLVNQKSLAFAYARNFSKRFIVGTGAIINSKPILFPMVLNNKGRWIGKIV